MGQISTLAAYNSVIGNLLQAENNENQADVQVSSGKVASDLEGYGTNAEALIAAEAMQTRVNGYVQAATNASSQLDAQNSALTEISSAGQDAQQAIEQAIANGDGDGLMASLQSAFSEAVDGLNTQYNGAYLFSGSNVTTPAVGVQNLSDLAPSGSGLGFQNDNNPASVQLDETTTVQTGMLASSIGTPLFQAFQAIAQANAGPDGPFTGALSSAQQADLTSILQSFDSANSGLTETTAQNGLLQNQVSAIQTDQQQQQTNLQTTIGNMTDVDMGQASAQLSQAQTALQASARVFESLQSTSLLNYLGTSGTLG